MHVTVQEIVISELEESQRKYFLRVEWNGPDLGSGFQLLLTDGRHAWRGEVTEDAVRGEAEELEMQKEKYVQDLHQALTERETSVTYSFTLTPSQPNYDSTVTLAYEKVQKNISFRLGSVTLSTAPEPAKAVGDLLVHGLQRGSKLERHNQKLEEENRKLRQEQQHITAQLERYAMAKEALESELYSHFVLVLNEKKAKIRSLQQTVAKLEDARISVKHQKEVRNSQAAAKHEGNAEDEYGASTDEEQQGEQAQAASVTPQSQESGSRCLLDDGVSDITDVDVAPCRKRRFRHLAAPEAPAKRAAAQTSQRRRKDPPATATSLNKQKTPQHSPKEATSPTAEDLFGDF